MQYVVARVEDPYGRHADDDRLPLQIGQFVQATIQGVSADQMVRLPRHLLRPDHSVLVTAADRKLYIKPVQVRRETSEYAFLSSGLLETDQIIETAIEFPVEGMELRIEGEQVEADLDAEAEIADASQVVEN
jgi:virulence-associated protein VagC